MIKTMVNDMYSPHDQCAVLDLVLPQTHRNPIILISVISSACSLLLEVLDSAPWTVVMTPFVHYK